MKTIKLTYCDKEYEVLDEDINMFRKYLKEVQGFNETSITVHISFMYSGNKLAIGEFLKWYDWYKNAKEKG